MVTRFELHGMTLSEDIAIKALINISEMNLGVNILAKFLF
jgi:hypothetical protein